MQSFLFLQNYARRRLRHGDRVVRTEEVVVSLKEFLNVAGAVKGLLVHTPDRHG